MLIRQVSSDSAQLGDGRLAQPGQQRLGPPGSGNLGPVGSGECRSAAGFGPSGKADSAQSGKGDAGVAFCRHGPYLGSSDPARKKLAQPGFRSEGGLGKLGPPEFGINRVWDDSVRPLQIQFLYLFLPGRNV